MQTKGVLNSKNSSLIHRLTLMGIMIALSITFGKLIALNFGGAIRFSFENLPIMIASIALGPIEGAITGVTADVIGCFIVGYEINPMVTLGAGAVGLLAGLVYRATGYLPNIVRVLLSVLSSHLIGSIIIKTIGLAELYFRTQNMGFFTLLMIRSAIYVSLTAIEGAIIYLLLRNKAISRYIGSFQGKKREDKMSYEKTLEYIHTISWEFCKPGLDRISKLCKGLNNPQNSLKFIHVAGTNGKGSFCSMLSSILTKSGYKTGLYTSPYILNFNERMSIDGKDISNDELVNITSRVKKIADKMEEKPTEFELVTAIALEYFKENQCEYVVLECGLGGRLDSTNIVSTTELSVITGISLDHTSILGDTVEKIAYEKAGIIKEGVPTLYCGKDENALSVIKKVAENNHSPLYFPNHSLINIKKMDLNSTVFDYKEYENLEISLLGSYQPINASNVISAVEILKNQGLNIPNETIYEGLKSAKWKARFERISTTPTIIFDGAHNPEGVLASVESIKKYFGYEKSYVITGVMADKDYNFMAQKISQVADKVFCITPDNKRALDADKYAEVYRGLDIIANGYDTIENALSDAISEATTNNKAIFCLGSLYMYSELLPIAQKLTKATKN